MSARDAEASWFFSAPEDDTVVRRGDPLGLRDRAEEYARVLAPGVTNRTYDARWITILAWILTRGHEAWRAYGGGDGAVASRAEAKELYRWIRPLELLWIARTTRATSDRGRGRQVPGVRAVRRWLDDKQLDHFGLGPAPYERYRFTGVYGAYRSVLRSLPDLTAGGDGWRPGPQARVLATIVERHAACQPIRAQRRGVRPRPEAYWLRAFTWSADRTHFLPTPVNTPSKLPQKEAGTLAALLFGQGDDGGLRRAVVRASARSRARSRADLLEDVVNSPGLAGAKGELEDLPTFCALADAGIDAMNACWGVLATARGSDRRGVALDSLVARAGVRRAFGELRTAATTWAGTRAEAHGVADSLARSMAVAGSDDRRLFSALASHHRDHGTGLQWLALRDGQVEPLVPVRGTFATRYRFRIAALCRLGVQCGVIDRMPQALSARDEFDIEDGSDG